MIQSRFLDTRDIPWDVFLPMNRSFNAKRNKLFQAVRLLLDESMFGWKPKTSKTGGLVNIAYEPHKPKDLGVLMRNSACADTGRNH